MHRYSFESVAKIAFVLILSKMMLCRGFLFKKLPSSQLRQLALRSSSLENSSGAYPNFSFIVDKVSKDSKARLGTLSTPHGTVSTPNFIFCGTKAAMKAVTPSQMREANAQIMLSNTYHLMLTPGPDIVEKMGGLQKFSGWNGPMLTDSGGYQIFSMGFGSVSNEIKGKRLNPSGENKDGNQQTLLKIDEQGATFRSFIDGSIHELTPEKSIQIQRKLGADLIVVLDECTPFNVDRNYTEQSMHRSHRWGDRSLSEFLSSCSSSEDRHYGRQALYGIVQGGVHKDLRDVSCAYVNSRAFFGTAIGGSLGDSRECMYDIVAYTRQRVRDDRPVHLLGIGGVRDIFHGVRCGIDTFDCVHPSRMARHGGALVMAAHWDEQQSENEGDLEQGDGLSDQERASVVNRWKRMLNGDEKSQIEYFQRQSLLHRRIVLQYMESLPAPVVRTLRNGSTKTGRDWAALSGKIRQLYEEACTVNGGPPEPSRRSKTKSRTAVGSAKENIHLTNGRYRNDPRPIDPTCGCYTCSGGFSRAYLNHLFKAGETLGGSLVTIHNVYFMNRLMKDIREGIKNDNLNEVEKRYVHPTLAD